MAQCALFSHFAPFTTKDGTLICNPRMKFGARFKSPPRELLFSSASANKAFLSSRRSFSQISSSAKGHVSFSMPWKAPSSTRHGISVIPFSTPLGSHEKTVTVKAKKDDAPGYTGYPPMTKKPEWWWRVLSCLPYLIPIHIAWVYAEEIHEMHPFLQTYEYYTYPFLFFLAELPGWFFTFYFLFTYLGVVRENRWPHFFRYHMITGMLVEMSIEFCATICDFLPTLFYDGRIGEYLWFYFTWTFLLTAIGCLVCAIAGIYPDIPFLSRAAALQIPYNTDE